MGILQLQAHNTAFAATALHVATMAILSLFCDQKFAISYQSYGHNVS